GERRHGLRAVGVELQAAQQERSRIGVLLAVVQRETERDEGERSIGLDALGGLQRIDGRRHVADLHQRDAEQVLVLRHGRADARQRIERRDGGQRQLDAERELRERAQHLLRVRRERERTLKRLDRSEEHTSELQSPYDLVCRLL